MNLFAQIRRAMGELGQLPARLDANLQRRLAQPLPGLRRSPIRPAEVSRKLEKIMLARENMLEDANYGLVVPNEYLVEVSQVLYDQDYRPIEKHLCDQWQERLLDRLITANSRLGEKKYRFGGPVQIRIQAAAGLVESQVRVRGRISAGVDGTRPDPAKTPAASGSTVQLATAACLSLLPAGPRYPLLPGVVTIGRGPACDIHLDRPDVQQKRLVSGLHAHVRCEGGVCRLYDGAPGGYSSANGTFVNGQKLGTEGHILQNGDVVVLAALDPARPRPDVPGAAGFIFYDQTG